MRPITHKLLLLAISCLFFFDLLIAFTNVNAVTSTTALTNVTDTVTNTQISASTSHRVDFTTYTTVPADGKMVITFPAGFDVSKVHTPAAVKQWNGSAWDLAGANESDIAFAKLQAQPNSGAIFSALYEDDTSTTDDLLETHLTGGSSTWSNQAQTWAGPVSRNLGLTKVDLAARKDSGSTAAMMAYDTQTISTFLQYRLWDGAAWTNASSTQAISGELRHQVIKYSSTRNEAILVTLGSTGQVQAQVWNGSAWGEVATLGTMANSSGSRDTQSLYRGFDLEYETLSGDAVVVYGDGTAEPDYRIWNGSSWSDAVNIDIPTTGMVNWLELAASPIDDSLGLITLDSNTDVYGLRWTGSAWDNMGATTVWDATASTATKKAIDVAYEKTSGDILYMWGDATSTDQYYRTYSSATLSDATLLDNSQAGGVDHWVKLVADPSTGSNKIMFGVLDAGADLNTFEWSGEAWSAVHTEHSSATEDIVDMNFDLAYETYAANAGKAWLVWGDGLTVSAQLWDGVSAWAAATTRGDDTAYISLDAQPNSGAIFSSMYEDDTSATDDLLEMHLVGGTSTWTLQSQTWAGPVTRNLGLTKTAIASRKDSGSTAAITIYDTQTLTTTPKYRLWDGAAWGNEASASAVNGEIRHQVIKYSPIRNEAILVTLGSTGEVQAQVWNGTTWGTATTLGTMANSDGSRDAQSLYRGFDLEYETTSGDAIVVYGDDTADPDYRVWNGTTWSDAVNIDIPTTGMVNWLELAGSPIDDSLGLITLDSNTDIYGLRWTGDAWDNMAAATVWDATASIATKKAIDVAFEKTSGDIMFIWGDATSTDQYYRTYSSATLSGATLLDNSQAGGVDHWIKLASDPSAASNKIMFGVLDAGSDLNTFEWSGSAWGAVHTEHSATTEDIVDMNFDIAYETYAANAGKAWLVWGDGVITKSTWSGFDGNKTVSVDGQTVTVTRDGTGTASTAGAKYITLSGITNTNTAGTNYTVTIETQTSAGVTLDGPTNSFYFSICANSCHTSTIDIPWMALTSTSTKHTLKFTTASAIPADGKMKIIFPAGFDISGATFDSWSNFDGGRTMAIDGQTITITRDNTGTSTAAGAKYIILDNIINSATENYYYPTIETTQANDTNIQGPTGLRMLIVDNTHGLATSAWPAPSYNMQATRKTNVTGPEYPTVKWASTLEQDLTHSSLYFYCVGQTGNIYAKLNDDTVDYGGQIRPLVLAINSNGDILWQKTTNTNDFCVASADGTVYFGGGFYTTNGQWEGRQESDGSLIARGSSGWGSHIGLTPDGKVIIKGYGATNFFDIHGGFLSSLGSTWDQRAQISIYSDNSMNIERSASAREMVYYPDGRLNYSFSWSLGVTPTIDENDFGYVFSGGVNNDYKAFNGGSGSTLWTTSLPGTAPVGLPSAQDSSRIYTTLSTNQLYALNKSDGSALWTLDNVVHANSSPILDNNDIIYVLDPSKYLVAYDSNGNSSPDFKWRYNSAVQAYLHAAQANDLGPMIFDNNGNIITYDITNKKAVSFQPWTLSAAITPAGYYEPGDTLTFTATTTMLATDPLTSEANKIQVYLADSTKVLLTYSTTSGAYTIWTGPYQIPAGTRDNTYAATIEAGAVNVETDTTIHLASAPTNSNNTGITTTINYVVDTTAPTGTTLAIGTATSNSISVSVSGSADSSAGLHASPYYFYETSTAETSGWQAAATWTHSLLTENTRYHYQAKARDATNTPNASTFADPVSVYTLVATPTNLEKISYTADGIKLQVDSFTNDTTALSGYYFYRSDDASINSGWMKRNYWTDKAVCGQTYSYAVKYRNGDGVQTSALTLSTPAGDCGSLATQTSTNPAPTAAVDKPTVVDKQTAVTEEPSSNMSTERAIQIAQLEQEARMISSANVDDILTAVSAKRDLALEQVIAKTTVAKVIGPLTPLPEVRYALINFVTYGTPETLKLGVGERAGVVDSFKAAFGKLPGTAADWEDVMKISVGRWPSQTSVDKEAEAIKDFTKIYKRQPDRTNPHDDAAVVVITYGLRPGARNLESEQVAFQVYRRIFKTNPTAVYDWDIIRAIAYSGAERD